MFCPQRFCDYHCDYDQPLDFWNGTSEYVYFERSSVLCVECVDDPDDDFWEESEGVDSRAFGGYD